MKRKLHLQGHYLTLKSERVSPHTFFFAAVSFQHGLLIRNNIFADTPSGLHNMGSAGSTAPRKFEGKSSYGRKYWSLEEKHRIFENDQKQKMWAPPYLAGAGFLLAQLYLNRNK